VRGLWLRDWQLVEGELVEGDDFETPHARALTKVRVLRVNGARAPPHLSLALPTLRWLGVEGAAAPEAEHTWGMSVKVSCR
jgi:hypothetical protein